MNLTVIVGRVGRAHGIRGDVSIDMATDEPKRRFAKGAKLRLADETHVEVASVRWHGSRLLVSFVGYPDRTAVERLTGQELWTTVRTDERPDDPEEFYDRHLIGLEVRRADGTTAGVVTEVTHLPSQDLLTVDVDGEERLVPFVGELVPTVDLEGGYLQLADVHGLLEDPL
ncbi:MAG: ribosome maturation factor RimM [Propionibacterium sp.]|nr:ribosome maturation factor RimM [Propionibacterium sp.]